MHKVNLMSRSYRGHGIKFWLALLKIPNVEVGRKESWVMVVGAED